MDDILIGPNPCQDCGGEYGEHYPDCGTLPDEPKPVRTRLAERLAAMGPIEQIVNLVLMGRWITRRPFRPEVFKNNGLGAVYEIRFGNDVLGLVAKRKGHARAESWRVHGTAEMFPTLRDAERRLVEANIGKIMRALAPQEVGK